MDSLLSLFLLFDSVTFELYDLFVKLVNSLSQQLQLVLRVLIQLYIT